MELRYLELRAKFTRHFSGSTHHLLAMSPVSAWKGEFYKTGIVRLPTLPRTQYSAYRQWINLPKRRPQPPTMKKDPASNGVVTRFNFIYFVPELDSDFLTCARRMQHHLFCLTSRIICAISLTNTLVEYYSTQGACAPNNGPCAWLPPTKTMTYPSLVCLGAAYLNLLLSAIVLIAYVWGTAKADQWENTRGMFEKACTALKITLSSAAAGSMYANQSSSGAVQSLWGQACNPVTQANDLLTQLVNFDQFCIQQVHTCGKATLTLVAIGGWDASRAYSFRRPHRCHICPELLGRSTEEEG